ncbi:MAG: lysylphosphatidylglycerol synthase transmembrane domain-containing protein [Gemmatimonadota bacterium]|nr:lysylphosphatidylglycerol synthase transmembrane domain-containing protein [Gemmatimonadota bacterium]
MAETESMGADGSGETAGVRRRWLTAGKALLGLALLAWILGQLEWGRVLDLAASPSWGWLALAVVLQAAAKLLWAVRWSELLTAFDVRRRFRDLLAFVMIGHFFNSFFPTSMGGDLVRGYYVSEGTSGEEGGLMTSYGVLLVERLLGLAVLAALAGAGSAYVLLESGEPVPEEWLFAVLAVSFGTAVAIGVLLAWPGTSKLLTRISGGLPRFGEELARFAAGLGVFHRSRVATARILLHTVAIQAVAVAFYVACGHAVDLDAPAWVFLVAVPVSIVATLIPVTLNGLGVREGVLVGFLGAYGADPDRAGAMVLLALAVSVAFSAAGGLLFPFYRNPRRKVRGAGPPS